jgi:hypothetical protein
MLYYLLFCFLAVGAKLLLALVMIYLLLPAERSCNHCDTETLLLQMSGGRRGLSRLCLNTLQRRWCPGCGWEGYARTVRPPRRSPASSTGTASPRHNDAREFLN